MHTEAEHSPNPLVLLIEDEPNQLESLSDILEQENLTPICCATGTEALKACLQYDVHVAILDLHLNDIDGLKLLEQLLLYRRDLKVIIHTGYASLDNAMAAINHGAFAYVQKLDRIEELLAHVHRAFHLYLADHSEQLEMEVQRRTQEWAQANQELKAEIRQRQQTQAELQESQDRYRTLVDELDGIVWEARASDMQFTFVSRQAEAILGYPVEQWLEEPDFWIRRIHPVDRDVAISTCQTVHGNSEFRHTLEYRFMAADGRVVWLRDYCRHITDASGALVKVHGLMMDISDRKRLEREILDLSEREQRRFGRDLHDGLGQLLTGTALTSKLLAEKLAKQKRPEAQEANRIVELVNQAIRHTHDLAHSFYPEALESHGLIKALEILVAQVKTTFGIACALQSEIDDDGLTLTAALHLYRIVQEAITNAVKHGRATVVSIAMRMICGQPCLEIEDNGVGMPEQVDNGLGMGLNNMRARAAILGTTLNITRLPSGGTLIACRLPFDSEDKPVRSQLS